MAGLLTFAGAIWLNSSVCCAQTSPNQPTNPAPAPAVAPKPIQVPNTKPKPAPIPVPVLVLPPVQTRIEQPMLPARILGPGPVFRFVADLSRLPELTLLPPLRREEEE